MPSFTEAPSIEESIKIKAHELAQMVRFLGRMDDVDSMFNDLADWAEGNNLDNPDLEKNYPGWTAEDFKKLLKESGTSVEYIRSRIG